MTTPIPERGDADPSAAVTRAIATANTPGAPDPTLATLRVIQSESHAHVALVNTQLEVIRERINAVEATANAYRAGALDLVTQRMDDADRASIILAENVNRTPTLLQSAITSMKELEDVKFAGVRSAALSLTDSINDRFELLDKQTVREKAAADLALAAAFDAQKEAACLSIASMILCADLVWRPAGDLLPGDELIAFDEDTPTNNNSGRRYRKAVVTANTISRAPLVRVNTPLGSVRCTPEHPWLIRRWRGRAYEWCRADELRPGDGALRMLDVWDVDRSWDAGWLAGILDGEGCLTFKSRANGGGKISIGQVDGDTADRIEMALKEREINAVRHTRKAGEHTTFAGQSYHAQAQRRWEVNQRADVMRLLGSVRPPRLLQHADQVWEGFSIRGHERMTTITSVEGDGSGLIARLSTSTHTYIGDGFAMHNSATNSANSEAIRKSELATAETIKTNAEAVRAGQVSLTDKIDDVKDRMNRIESLIVAIQTQRTTTHEGKAGSQATMNLGLAAATVALTIISVIAVVWGLTGR